MFWNVVDGEFIPTLLGIGTLAWFFLTMLVIFGWAYIDADELSYDWVINLILSPVLAAIAVAFIAAMWLLSWFRVMTIGLAVFLVCAYLIEKAGSRFRKRH